SPRLLAKQLQKVLTRLRDNPQARYGAGNLIDIYAMLGIDLTGYDFSELAIWQTDLSSLRLHAVNLSDSHCQDVVFLNALGAVIQINYHPQGEQIATGDSQGLIKIWRVHDGQIEQTLRGHQAFVTGLAFSADGQWLASVDMERTVKIWQLATGRCEHSQQLPGLYPRAIALGADGQQFAVGGVDGTVELWSWVQGTVERLVGHQGTVRSLCLQATSLWSASYDGTIRQWDITSNAPMQTLMAQGQSVLMISLSADGQTLLSQGSEGAIQIWDTTTGECRQVWSHPESKGGTALLHPQGDCFAITAGACLQLWDTATGQPRQTLLGHHEIISSLAFSPDGQTVVSASQKECAIFWSVETGDRLRTLSGFVNEIWSLAWFPMRTDVKPVQMLSGHTDGYLRIWDAEARSLIREVPAHEGNIFAIAWSPDGQLLATGGGAGQLKLWDAPVQHCLQTQAAHAGILWGLAWRPDGKQLATGGADRLIKLWDTHTWTVVQERPTEKKLPITRLAWSPDGQQLAIASIDFSVHIWDLSTGDYRCIFQGQKSWVLDLAWTADSQTLMLTGDVGNVQFWRRNGGLQAEPFSIGQQVCWSMQLLANGQLLTSSERGLIQLWDLANPEPLATLTGHRGPVAALVLSANQQLVASSSHDGTIRLWDLAAQTCLGVMQSPRPYEGLKIEGLTGVTAEQIQALKLLGAVGES
ncbi:MAG: WD40 repeat domain-containing protein, partial [Spirulina sp. SIO3F2]|nr:WD40 repeat domain-containing protein [Spirulina sp. SIO3F2]